MIHGKPLKEFPEYSVWKGIKERCYNPNSKDYKNYGGRGIKVCERWLKSFPAFYEDMGNKPLSTSIERINNDSDYEPSNCKWATRAEQNMNKRLYSNNTTGYKGVDFDRLNSKYRVRYRKKNYGYYLTLEDAIERRKVIELTIP